MASDVETADCYGATLALATVDHVTDTLFRRPTPATGKNYPRLSPAHRRNPGYLGTALPWIEEVSAEAVVGRVKS